MIHSSDTSKTALPSLAARGTGLFEVRTLLSDLLCSRAWIYWPDLLVSTSLGWFLFALTITTESFGLLVLFGVGATLCLYRAALFIHEISHFKRGSLPGFEIAWNLVVGWPLMVPSFMYVGVHTDHHRRTFYGTAKDPEYLPLALTSRRRVIAFIGESLAVPFLLAFRFLVLAPFGLLVPRLHKFLEQSASSLVINPSYRRRPLVPRERRYMKFSEVAILLIWGSVVGLVLSEILPSTVFLVWALISAGVALVNQVRTLGAHRYENSGGELDVLGQLLDSVNIPGGACTELWAPVGLRYHALHHYVPDLPYHSLGVAHRRLMARLPADAPYRKTSGSSLWSVLRNLWSTAGRSERSASCPSSTSTAS